MKFKVVCPITKETIHKTNSQRQAMLIAMEHEAKVFCGKYERYDYSKNRKAVLE